MTDSRQQSSAEAQSAVIASEAVLTLRPGLSPARLKLDLDLDSLMALPTGAGYVADSGRLRVTARRTQAGVALEAEADSVGPELTLIERADSRLTANRCEEIIDDHKSTRKDPWHPVAIVVIVATVLIFIITLIKKLTK